MNKCLILISLVLLFSATVFTQSKSLTKAQEEIKTFTNPNNFSVIYDQTRYVTKAEVKFDILKAKTPLAKQFKEFKFKVTSLFATDGIDQKPVRTTLCINTRSKKFYFSSRRSLTLTIDSKTINLGEGNRSTKIKGRKIRENLCWEIDKELVQDLGKASSINYQIGAIKGNLNSTKLQFFRNYTRLISISKT